MEGFGNLDMFATKGLEYLLVLGFLAVFFILWRLMFVTGVPVPVRPVVPLRNRSISDWFRLDEDLHYHQGHSWAKAAGGPLVVVGVDDFAQKLLGEPDLVDLPEIGSRLEQGGVGWRLRVNTQFVDMLSPVSGEVVAINRKVLKSPRLLTEDPYGEGWLAKVRVHNTKTVLKNLLTGRTARAWMEETAGALSRRMSGQLGLVMQDGGTPLPGFAMQLSRENWQEVVAEFLMNR